MKTVIKNSDFNAIDTHIIASNYEVKIGAIFLIEKIDNNQVNIISSDNISHIVDIDEINNIISDYKYIVIEGYSHTLVDCISWEYIEGGKVRFKCVSDYDLYDGTDGTDRYHTLIKPIDDILIEYIRREEGKYSIRDIINFFVNNNYKEIINSRVVSLDIFSKEQLELLEILIDDIEFIRDCMNELNKNNANDGILKTDIIEDGWNSIRLSHHKLFDYGVTITIRVPEASGLKRDDDLSVLLEYLFNIRANIKKKLEERENTLVKSERITKVLSKV